MNLPTKITVSRIIMSPLFFLIFYLPEWTGGAFTQASVWVLIPLFIVMELSDALDGYIARKYNLVTDLGKILDPFSDVISRVTFFICFTGIGLMPLWMLLLILYRELGITFLRMFMMGRGTAMAASIWGKLKAITYTISSVGGLLYVAVVRLGWGSPQLFATGRTALLFLFGFAVFASLASFTTYAVHVARSTK